MPTSGTEKVPEVDDRIADVRFNHPSGCSATGGIDLPLALRMASEHGGSVDVCLSDYECWFELVQGPAWRIDTLTAVIRQQVLAEVKEGLPDAIAAAMDAHAEAERGLKEMLDAGCSGGDFAEVPTAMESAAEAALATLTPEEEK